MRFVVFSAVFLIIPVFCSVTPYQVVYSADNSEKPNDRIKEPGELIFFFSLPLEIILNGLHRRSKRNDKRGVLAQNQGNVCLDSFGI